MTTRKELLEKGEANGIIVVQHIVTQQWNSRFQEFSARNDDGIDGLILLRENGRATGVIVHCQIKSGSGYLSSETNGELRINVGGVYIDSHRPRWRSIVEPCILVYVEESGKNQLGRAWWTDLKNSDTYDPQAIGIIRIPKSQRLHPDSKGDLNKLYGGRVVDHLLPVIRCHRADVNFIGYNSSIKREGRARFLAWRATPPTLRQNPVLGEITVSRVAWRHLTRRGRKRERVLQSMLLLDVARMIANTVREWTPLRNQYRTTETEDSLISKGKIALRARIVFPHRYESVVTVILKRYSVHSMHSGELIESKTWFYSVYESRRGVLN